MSSQFESAPATSRAGLPPLPALPREEAPTRSRVRTRRLIALAATMAWLALSISGFGVRRDHADFTTAYLIGSPAVLAIVCSGALYVALSGGRRGVGSARWKQTAALLWIAAAFAASSVWVESGPNSVIPAGAMSASARIALCGGVATLLAAVPLGVAVWALRRAFPLDPGVRGAVVGACCGLAAASVTHLTCPVATVGHVLIAHGMPILLGAWAGWVAGRRWLRA